QSSGGRVKQRHTRAELLAPLFANRTLIPGGEIFGRDIRQRRRVGERRSPVGGAGEADSDGAERLHLGREQAGLGYLRDLGFVALLSGLLPKGDEVRRDRERVEDFAVLGLEFCDLGGVIVRSVGIGTRIYYSVAFLA